MNPHLYFERGAVRVDARGLEVRQRNEFCVVSVPLGGYEPRSCEVGEGRGRGEVLDGHGDCLRLVGGSLLEGLGGVDLK